MIRGAVWGLCLLACLASPGDLGAQDLPGDRFIRKYLQARARELERDLLPQIQSARDLEEARPALRAAYLDMLALDPEAERTPLQAQVTGRLERPTFTVDLVHFQSRPGLYVTGNLFLPRPAPGRCPAILYLSSHLPRGRDGNKTAHVDQGLWFATHGFALFILDTLELGEIPGVHRGTLRQSRWWWHSAGYSPAAVETLNAIRALDYLSSRPEVDPERLGVTGISGGGAVSLWLAAADGRVRAAAPVSGTGDLEFYVGEDGVNLHCDCLLPYNYPRWNWSSMAALIAPRPLLFVNSDRDVYFPLTAIERVFGRLERFYARLGSGDRLQPVLSVGGHSYRTDIRRAVAEFFNRCLKGDARPVLDPDAGLAAESQIERTRLRVFPEDPDLPRDSINARVDELFVPRARLAAPPSGDFEVFRERLLGRLRERCFGAWPSRAPGEPSRPLGSQPEEGREETEPGIEVSWSWVPGEGKTRWVIVLGPDEALRALPDWAGPLVGKGPALLLSPRGGGPGTWTRKTPPNTIERSMTLLGQTVDGGRVWDVISAVRRRSEQGPWAVAGRGKAGIIGAYAALYEPAIAEVAVLDPPSSHAPGPGTSEVGPAFLGVLRVLDIPEALGCLAPRTLRLIHGRDPAFDRTAELYRAAGAPDRLSRN